jgi:hypothetical protein
MIFVSKARELRLIRKPADRIMDEFRRPIILRGERAEFENHRYSTEDPGMIDWLLHNPAYGVSYTSASPDKGSDNPKVVVPTGPEVTDEVYQQEVKKQKVEMIRGAMNTSNAPAKSEVVKENEAPMDKASMTEEEVVNLIDSKLEAGFEKLMNVLLNAKQQESAPKEKKTVTCKACGQTGFASGFEVGMHRKTDCPALKKE